MTLVHLADNSFVRHLDEVLESVNPEDLENPDFPDIEHQPGVVGESVVCELDPELRRVYAAANSSRAAYHNQKEMLLDMKQSDSMPEEDELRLAYEMCDWFKRDAYVFLAMFECMVKDRYPDALLNANHEWEIRNGWLLIEILKEEKPAARSGQSVRRAAASGAAVRMHLS